MSRRKNVFPVVSPQKLLQTLSVAVYIDDPSRMTSLVMGTPKDNYRVPLDVARLIYKRIGNAISRAEAINEYKMTVGCNPEWPYDV